MFIEEGEKYLIILPEKDGDHGYWQHIALITTPVSHVKLSISRQKQRSAIFEIVPPLVK